MQWELVKWRDFLANLTTNGCIIYYIHDVSPKSHPLVSLTSSHNHNWVAEGSSLLVGLPLALAFGLFRLRKETPFLLSHASFRGVSFISDVCFHYHHSGAHILHSEHTKKKHIFPMPLKCYQNAITQLYIYGCALHVPGPPPPAPPPMVWSPPPLPRPVPRSTSSNTRSTTSTSTT